MGRIKLRNAQGQRLDAPRRGKPGKGGGAHIARMLHIDPPPQTEAYRQAKALASAALAKLQEISARNGGIVTGMAIEAPAAGGDTTGRLTVRFLAYGRHGVPQTFSREIQLRPRWGGDLLDEASLLDQMEKQYAKTFAHQAELAAKWGGGEPASHWDPSRIDLSLYTVQSPLWRMLVDRVENPHEALRAMIHAGPEVMSGHYALARLKLPPRFQVTTSAGRITAEFEIDDTTAWKNGAVKIKDIAIPETSVIALKGGRLGDLVRHPYLDPDIAITGTDSSTTKESGKPRYAFMTHGSLIPIPKETA